MRTSDGEATAATGSLLRAGVRLCGMLAAALLGAGTLAPAPGWAHHPPVWVGQLGTVETEEFTQMSADTLGNVYLAGATWGCFALDCDPERHRDGWFAKYEANGTLAWVRQVGNPGDYADGDDQARDIAAGPAGGVFVVGATNSGFAGKSHGDFDAWVGKYTEAGDPLWLRQYGTADGDGADRLAVDPAGDVLVAGVTWAAFAGRYHGSTYVFVAKLRGGDGTVVWARQFGTDSADGVDGTATDAAGNVFLAGFTGAALAGPYRGQDDAWLKKYSADGQALWQRQIGTEQRDRATAVATDANGDVFVTGYTLGCLTGRCPGAGDAWLAKYRGGDGRLLWRRQFGTAGYDEAWGLAADASGNVIVSGGTSGDFAGRSRGSRDAWLAAFSGDGRPLWRRQLGTSADDGALAAADAGAGCAYLAGETQGSLGGPFAGGYGDAWVAKVCAGD